MRAKAATRPESREESKPRKNGQIYQLAEEKDYLAKEKRVEDADVKESPVKKRLTAEDFYLKVEEVTGEDGATILPGLVVEMEDFFGVPVLNTLWTMMAGKRYLRIFFRVHYFICLGFLLTGDICSTGSGHYYIK